MMSRKQSTMSMQFTFYYYALFFTRSANPLRNVYHSTENCAAINMSSILVSKIKRIAVLFFFSKLLQKVSDIFFVELLIFIYPAITPNGCYWVSFLKIIEKFIILLTSSVSTAEQLFSKCVYF